MACSIAKATLYFLNAQGLVAYWPCTQLKQPHYTPKFIQTNILELLLYTGR